MIAVASRQVKVNVSWTHYILDDDDGERHCKGRLYKEETQLTVPTASKNGKRR